MSEIVKQPCTITTIYSAGQQWAETTRCHGNVLTMMNGTYEFTNGVIARKLLEWEPKQRFIADGRGGGRYEQNAIPAAGSGRITFDSPNAMTWTDVALGGKVTFRRQ